MSDPIESLDDLTQYFRAGIKQVSERRVGTEHEKFGILDADASMRPLPYTGGIDRVLSHLVEHHGWTPVYDGEHIIGLNRDRAAISLEPGAQFELSGAPLRHLDETRDELALHFREIAEISRELGVQWLAMGAHPSAALDDIVVVPKSRYAIMHRYMPKVGTLGHSMMKRTCTVQANFDYTSEADAADILNLGQRLSPIIAALFATSPFLEGQPSGKLSTRLHFWTDTDGARSGYLPTMLEPGYTFGDYVEYLLDVPMYFIIRKEHGGYIDATHLTFRRFLEQGFEGERATLKDWENHMSTAFPEVRLKRYIEVRCADCGPAPLMLSCVALWKGVLYDANARSRAHALVDALDIETLHQLHLDMINEGLQARATALSGSPTLLELGRALTDIAAEGLAAQASETHPDESHHLEPLRARVLDPGRNLARQALARFDATASSAASALRDALEPFWIDLEGFGGLAT